jgi:hypothetical protein
MWPPAVPRRDRLRARRARELRGRERTGSEGSLFGKTEQRNSIFNR